MTIHPGDADKGPRPEDAGRTDKPFDRLAGHSAAQADTDDEPTPGPAAQHDVRPEANPESGSDSAHSASPATASDRGGHDAWWVPVLTAAGILAAGVVIFRRGGRVKAAAVMAAATPAAKAAQEVARQAAEKAERVSQVIREFAVLDYAYQSAAMDQSVTGAFRRHQHWTPDELAVLADTTKTALEKALELGRTFYGVKEKSIQMGFSSKPPL